MGLTARLRVFALVWLLVGVGASAASAQASRADLAQRCADPVRCADVVLAVEAIQAGIGLLHTAGSEFPGSTSTLGRRFGATPRVAVGVRAGVTTGGFPAVGRESPAPQTSTLTPSVQGALAIGLFDGFRPLPTVGGVFSLDLIGTVGAGFPSGGDGFERRSTSVGYGVRLGIVRESFTLPGITVSAVRRHLGDIDWNGPDGSVDGVVALTSPVATSLRATVGKDLLALGISGGIGWDRVRADGRFRPQSATGGTGAGGFDTPVAFSGFETSRSLVFGAVTGTFLVLQLHGELGYATGFDPLGSSADDGGFDPSAGSVFVTASARILF